jgi:hypothetical protein
MQDTTTPFLRPIPLWFGMVGAPIVWSLHLLLVWSVDEFGCRLGFDQGSILGINSLHALVLAPSLVALTVSAGAGVIAYRNWREIEALDDEQRERYARGVERGRFMAVTGMAFSALFSLVILYMTVPIFLLPPCHGLAVQLS